MIMQLKAEENYGIIAPPQQLHDAIMFYERKLTEGQPLTPQGKSLLSDVERKFKRYKLIEKELFNELRRFRDIKLSQQNTKTAFVFAMEDVVMLAKYDFKFEYFES